MGRLAFPPRTWRCALCRLRHQELLDAAHITPDSEAEGEPLVSNGVVLCKLHHAARCVCALRGSSRPLGNPASDGRPGSR